MDKNTNKPQAYATMYLAFHCHIPTQQYILLWWKLDMWPCLKEYYEKEFKDTIGRLHHIDVKDIAVFLCRQQFIEDGLFVCMNIHTLRAHLCTRSSTEKFVKNGKPFLHYNKNHVWIAEKGTEFSVFTQKPSPQKRVSADIHERTPICCILLFWWNPIVIITYKVSRRQIFSDQRHH